jgi:hypothetical protein
MWTFFYPSQYALYLSCTLGCRVWLFSLSLYPVPSLLVLSHLHPAHEEFRDMTLTDNLSIRPSTPLRVTEHELDGFPPTSVYTAQSMRLIGANSMKDGFVLTAGVDISGDRVAAELLGGFHSVEAIGQPVGFVVEVDLNGRQLDALFKSLGVFVNHGVIE